MSSSLTKDSVEELLFQFSRLKCEHVHVPMEGTEEYNVAGCAVKADLKDSDFKSKQTNKENTKKEERRDKTLSLTKGPGGEYRFQLSRMRFATVSKFQGTTLVGIREFYDAWGELKPGKKGISLTIEQWTRLKEQIDNIDKAVQELR